MALEAERHMRNEKFANVPNHYGLAELERHAALDSRYPFEKMERRLFMVKAEAAGSF